MEFLSKIGQRSVLEMAPMCYRSNNNYAYMYELYQNNPTKENERRLIGESKYSNFVPTYDKWCLTCNYKGVNKRCTKCRAVYFCDQSCAKKAWPIHKKHCGRNLFANCAFCGVENGTLIKCPECPVKFCNTICKEKIYQSHLEYDCQHFQKIFGKDYVV